MTTHSSITPIAMSRRNWSLKDTVWALGLYGTTVGAGTLFLPIEIGTRGAVIFLIMFLLGLPLSLMPHLLLCRVYMREEQTDNTTLPIFGSFFKGRGEKAIMLFYCLAFFPVTLVYSISLVNALNNYITVHLHLPEVNRGVLSFVVVAGLYGILSKGRDKVVGTMSALALPFAISILLIAATLIPQWSFSNLGSVVDDARSMQMDTLFKHIWLTLPLITFSFCCAPLISPLTSYYRDKKRGGEMKALFVIRVAYVAIFVSIIFFVLSCVLGISQATFVHARAQNLNVLSVMEGNSGFKLVFYLAPFIAIIGMTKSFLGVCLSVAETFAQLATTLVGSRSEAGKKRGKTLAFLVMAAITFGVVDANPNVITLIETFCGPLIAIILFLIPAYLIYTREELRMLRGFSAICVIIGGLATLSALLYSMV